MDPQRIFEQEYSAAARRGRHHADPGRSRLAVAEPDPDAPSHGTRRLDPRLRRAHQALARARLQICHAALPLARFLPLGNVSHQRCARQSDRTAALYRMHVPALLPVHGGRRAGGGRRQISRRRRVRRRRLFPPDFPGRPRRQISQGSAALQRRRHRLHQGHLHLHLQAARPLPRPLRRDLRAGRLAAGAPSRLELLRHAVQQRLHRDATRPSTALARFLKRQPAGQYREGSTMLPTFVETQTVRRARYIFVAILFLVLMVLVHGGAELKAWLDPPGPPAEGTVAELQTWLASGLPAVAHTAAYYRVIFSILATIILL